jgi:CRISPR-associated endoribonuclease Cas6
MRIAIELASAEADGTLSLPLQYNSEVQGLIHKNVDKVLANRIHDQGTPLGKRQFRFFTFSRLSGKYRIDGDLIEFSGPVRLRIGSVHEELLESLALHLLREPLVQLGKEECEVRRLEVEPLPRILRPTVVRTLSPITAYRTLYTAEGRRKTYYFNPSKGNGRSCSWRTSEGRLQPSAGGRSGWQPSRGRGLDLFGWGSRTCGSWSIAGR